MKTVVCMVAIFVIGSVGIYYGSCYVMGGIEGGMPNGGHGKFADYHDGNMITEFFEKESGSSAPGITSGDVTSNPFTQ